jgi:hypothetical protein
MFRSRVNRSALVRELQKATKNGELLKKARELLEDRGEGNSGKYPKSFQPPLLN